ncbi:MAG: hypothetical protein EBU70_09975, partial [Actinobacteria bacterium]|nr:hypothetical protein [Actinomycetota bacterium]
VSIPVTTIAGTEDPRYADEAVRIAAAVPRGRSVVVERVGHAVHAQRPDVVATAVRDALAAG